MGVATAAAATTSAAADCLMTSFAANYLAAEFKAAFPPSPSSCCAFAAINPACSSTPLRLHILLHLPGPPSETFFICFSYTFLLLSARTKEILEFFAQLFDSWRALTQLSLPLSSCLSHSLLSLSLFIYLTVCLPVKSYLCAWCRHLKIVRRRF